MIRDRLFTPPFVLLFALLNLLIGADVNSRLLLWLAGLTALASAGMLVRRRWQDRRAARRGAAPSSTSGWPRVWSCLRAAGLVLAAAYAEWIVLHLATDPWVERPPGPVRGEIRASGADFGKGTDWSPELCRPATNPGVMAAALMARDAPFPVAWIIARPGAGVAAIDVQRSADAPTVRFYPADCTRLHGDVQPVRASTGTGGLAGYADAECVHGGDALTVHVDFAACPSAPSMPVPK